MRSLGQIGFWVNSVSHLEQQPWHSGLLPEFLQAFHSGGGRFFFLSCEKKDLKSVLFRKLEMWAGQAGVTPVLVFPAAVRISSQWATELIRLKKKFPDFSVVLDEKTLRAKSNTAVLARLRTMGLEIFLLAGNPIPTPEQIVALGVGTVLCKAPSRLAQVLRNTQRFRKQNIQMAWIWDGTLATLPELSRVDGVRFWVLGDVLLSRAILSGAASATRQLLAELQAP